MGGLGLLLVIGLYLASAVLVVRVIPTAWGKALVIVAFILFPTADAWWGRNVTLRELCEDAGLKVFKTASKQDGLMYSGAVRRAVKHELGKSGYYDVRVEYWTGERWLREHELAFVEDRWPDKSYARLSLRDDKATQESNITPRAKYALTDWKDVPINIGRSFSSRELRIENRQSGEVIARYRVYRFEGGWAEQFLGGFADSGPQSVGCPAPVLSLSDILIRNTFN